ncbi:hypothetical protein J6590_093268 [Homalodisca vitripennis]|nr:hypothetical protein J6590_093268 [Homalodisca vitripennis]
MYITASRPSAIPYLHTQLVRRVSLPHAARSGSFGPELEHSPVRYTVLAYTTSSVEGVCRTRLAAGHLAQSWSMYITASRPSAIPYLHTQLVRRVSLPHAARSGSFGPELEHEVCRTQLAAGHLAQSWSMYITASRPSAIPYLHTQLVRRVSLPHAARSGSFGPELEHEVCCTRPAAGHLAQSWSMYITASRPSAIPYLHTQLVRRVSLPHAARSGSFGLELEHVYYS